MASVSNDRLKIFGLMIVVVVLALGLAYVVRENNQLRTEPNVNEGLPNTPPPAQTFQDDTGSIRVTNMRANQSLSNGFVVKGTAVAFEGRFVWRLLDGGGRAIGGGNVTARQPDVGVPGPYAFPAVFDAVPITPTGTLALYEPSAVDGSDLHVVRVPVTFGTAMREVDLYFGNTAKNPNAADCSLVYPVKRTVPDGVMPFIAVHALLQGPTAEERAEGVVTSLPENVAIESAEDRNGKAAIGLNGALRDGVAGSCLVTAIRAQLEHTATQGGSLPQYPIVIDGGTLEDVLQP